MRIFVTLAPYNTPYVAIKVTATSKMRYVVSAKGRILFDDSVMYKYGSQVIEGAVKQYSGNAHHPVMGIGAVTCVYYNPDNGRFYALDLRQYSLGDKQND